MKRKGRGGMEKERKRRREGKDEMIREDEK